MAFQSIRKSLPESVESSSRNIACHLFWLSTSLNLSTTAKAVNSIFFYICLHICKKKNSQIKNYTCFSWKRLSLPQISAVSNSLTVSKLLQQRNTIRKITQCFLPHWPPTKMYSISSLRAARKAQWSVSRLVFPTDYCNFQVNLAWSTKLCISFNWQMNKPFVINIWI